MRKSFLDSLETQRKLDKESSVQKSIRLSSDIVDKLDATRKRMSKILGRNVALSHMIRSIIDFHLEIVKDLPDIEEDTVEVEVSSSQADSTSNSPAEEDVGLGVVIDEEEELDDEDILRMLGDTSKKTSRTWNP